MERLTVFGLILLLAFPTAGRAGLPSEDEILLKTLDPPPPGWEVLRDAPATSSSHCIGTVTTPECAVATEMACRLWERMDFCYISRWWEGEVDFGSTPAPREYIQYRFVESRPYDPRDQAKYPIEVYHENISAVSGATWRVAMVERSCQIGSGLCVTGELQPYYYFLSATRRGWLVVSIESNRFPDRNKHCFEYDLPIVSRTRELCRDGLLLSKPRP